MSTPTMARCHECRQVGLEAQLATCAKCARLLCYGCAVEARCDGGGDHAPPGWSVKLLSGWWSLGEFWPGRRLHGRATPAGLRGLVVRHPGATLSLWVDTPDRDLVPPDLAVGRPVLLAWKGRPFVGGPVADITHGEGGLVLTVHAAMAGIGDPAAWTSRPAGARRPKATDAPYTGPVCGLCGIVHPPAPKPAAPKPEDVHEHPAALPAERLKELKEAMEAAAAKDRAWCLRFAPVPPAPPR